MGLAPMASSARSRSRSPSPGFCDVMHERRRRPHVVLKALLKANGLLGLLFPRSTSRVAVQRGTRSAWHICRVHMVQVSLRCGVPAAARLDRIEMPRRTCLPGSGGFRASPGCRGRALHPAAALMFTACAADLRPRCALLAHRRRHAGQAQMSPLADGGRGSRLLEAAATAPRWRLAVMWS